MYWKNASGNRVSGITLPLVTKGVNTDLTLTLVTESGENLSDVFLCTSIEDYANLFLAKLSTSSTYLPVGGPFVATCFLGDLSANTETDVDLRLSIGSSEDGGLRFIPIFVLEHGDPTGLGTYFWSDVDDVVLWSDVDDVVFWVDI